MSWYCDVERELTHIRAAIDLLERTKGHFATEMPVSNPAYWRARLNKIRERFEKEKIITVQINALYARLDKLQAEGARRDRFDSTA